MQHHISRRDCFLFDSGADSPTLRVTNVTGVRAAWRDSIPSRTVAGTRTPERLHELKITQFRSLFVRTVRYLFVKT